MIKVGIVGGAGYTAGELIRILLYHPDVQIEFVHSESHPGKFITDVHFDLIGETKLKFNDIKLDDINMLFLCMGHGKSREFLRANDIPKQIKIIDLSRDFRLNPENNEFVYGLPELNRQKIKNAARIANPGCFATGMQLTLLPLAHDNLLKSEVHISGITGSTGAGQLPGETTHFSWRNNNISVYKAFRHQHLDEVKQSIKQLQKDFDHAINFIPYRGNFSRGIIISMYTGCNLSEKEIVTIFKDYYKNEPFTHVIDKNPDVKLVVNTNKAFVFCKKFDDKLHVISVSDNLLKGASGQAVQNMNLAFGIPETNGLHLKSVAF
ncbi:N-acetyl-gamma-glutamyl-phosphate reductase [Bacteroidota bacterium]